MFWRKICRVAYKFYDKTGYVIITNNHSTLPVEVLGGNLYQIEIVDSPKTYYNFIIWIIPID